MCNNALGFHFCHPLRTQRAAAEIKSPENIGVRSLETSHSGEDFAQPRLRTAAVYLCSSVYVGFCLHTIFLSLSHQVLCALVTVCCWAAVSNCCHETLLAKCPIDFSSDSLKLKVKIPPVLFPADNSPFDAAVINMDIGFVSIKSLMQFSMFQPMEDVRVVATSLLMVLFCEGSALQQSLNTRFSLALFDFILL